MQHDTYDPHVPAGALQRPAGAAVDRGMVACVACRRSIPLAQADVVGLGYRCTPCSQRAEIAGLGGADDAASHLSTGERRDMAAAAANMMWGSVGAAVLGGVLLASGVRPVLGVGLLIAGVVVFTAGLFSKSAR